MVFSVKYRDSSGAVCEKAVEAANRADCFAKCKVQGIVPIGVVSMSVPCPKCKSTSAPSASLKMRNHQKFGSRRTKLCVLWV